MEPRSTTPNITQVGKKLAGEEQVVAYEGEKKNFGVYFRDISQEYEGHHPCNKAEILTFITAEKNVTEQGNENKIYEKEAGFFACKAHKDILATNTVGDLTLYVLGHSKRTDKLGNPDEVPTAEDGRIGFMPLNDVADIIVNRIENFVNSDSDREAENPIERNIKIELNSCESGLSIKGEKDSIAYALAQKIYEKFNTRSQAAIAAAQATLDGATTARHNAKQQFDTARAPLKQNATLLAAKEAVLAIEENTTLGPASFLEALRANIQNNEQLEEPEKLACLNIINQVRQQILLPFLNLQQANETIIHAKASLKHLRDTKYELKVTMIAPVGLDCWPSEKNGGKKFLKRYILPYEAETARDGEKTTEGEICNNLHIDRGELHELKAYAQGTEDSITQLELKANTIWDSGEEITINKDVFRKEIEPPTKSYPLGMFDKPTKSTENLPTKEAMHAFIKNVPNKNSSFSSVTFSLSNTEASRKEPDFPMEERQKSEKLKNLALQVARSAKTDHGYKL